MLRRVVAGAAVALGVLAAVLVVYYLVVPASRPPELWEIPDGYVGWIVVEYERPACPALPRQGQELVYRVSADGRLCISDPFREGTARDRFVYVSSEGARRELRVPDEARQLRYEGTTKRLLAFVGTKEEQEARRGTTPEGFGLR